LPVPSAYFSGADPKNLLDIYAKAPVGVLGFIAAIHKNRQPEPDFAVGVEVQEVVDATAAEVASATHSYAPRRRGSSLDTASLMMVATWPQVFLRRRDAHLRWHSDLGRGHKSR
jgi:hypothetical protein